ncbi:MAG: HAD family phosphatase [Oscillospiraceae bacterium]|nr:HAD family phosphatase [Oscillospiraceae bacterium]
MYFFDLDGVLIDSNGIWKDVDITFLARRGLPYTRAYYEGVAHTIFPLAAEFTKEFCNLSESCEEIMAEWMDLAKGLYSQVALKPGVRAYLEQCQAERRRMGVVTSSVPEHCQEALRHLDIARYFERVTFAHKLRLDKRSPELWRTAAELCGVRPSDCTVFDDSLLSCQGAKAAGMRVVGVYDAYFAHNENEMRGFCDAYIRDFTELLAGREDV